MSKARDLADFISDSTIETAELADNAVTSAKLDETDSYTVAGLTTTGDIVMGDDNKVTFGENPDFTIYHDSANLLNRIDANNFTMMVDTGNFRVRGDDETNMINAVRGAAVTLYHNNSPKFATTSTGIDVTGTAVTDGLTVSGNVSVDGGTIKLDGNYPVGTGNVALGNTALDTLTSGAYNTALGDLSLTSNVSSNSNTAAGAWALKDTTGSANTAVGAFSAYQNTTGVNNVAVGSNSFQDNTTGSNNTALGTSALENNTTASNNTAVGLNALYANTTGTNNTALGYAALDANTTAANNTAIGSSALTAVTTSNANTAVGYQSGLSTTTGYSNAFFGQISGKLVTTGALNTFIGRAAGEVVTTGSKNTIIGGYTGNQGGLDIRTSSNNIVLSDGDGNPRVHVNSSGHVGIGNPNPSAPLTVSYNNSSRDDTLFLTNTNTGGYGPWINFYGNYNGGYSFGRIGGENQSTGGVLSFQTSDTSGTLQENMRVGNNGDLWFRSGFGSLAVAYGCRVWVNFQGSGTVTIRGSGNVSSITDLDTGKYQVNFTTSMPDDNYATQVTGDGVAMYLADSLATTQVRVLAYSGGFLDYGEMQVAIFR